MICPWARTRLRMVVSESTSWSWVWDAEQAGEDGISRLLGGRFQFIERCLRLQGGDIGRGQVEGREFGHVVTVRIVNAADKHANMAHGVLLGQNNGYMLPQPEPLPDRNLTQRLFALTVTPPRRASRTGTVLPIQPWV